MTGIPEAIAAISGISTIAKGLISVRDDSKLMEVKSELLEKAFDLRQALDALQDEMSAVKSRNRELEQENQELQKRIDAVDEYELIQVIGGAHVLATKPVDGSTHKPPYYCHACHTDGKKSVLSFEKSFVSAHFPAHLNCQRDEQHQLNLPGGTTAKQLGYLQ